MYFNHQFFRKPGLYIVIVIIGALLKFYQINNKLFWEDEVSTVFYTSGKADNQYLGSAPVNQIRNIGYYDSLLHIKNLHHSIKSEIRGIFSDTHLTPAHYAFLTFWYRIAGDSTTSFRLFSVFIFIITLPFLFLFSKSLFGSNLAGWISISLFAVSPFINFYSQEARYYILWLFFFVLSNYTFLEAANKNRPYWWIFYSASSVLALYTSVLSALFISGHLIYILFLKKPLRRKYFICLLFIIVLYSPWAYFLFSVRDTIKNGLAWQTFYPPTTYSLEYLFFQITGFLKSFFFFDEQIDQALWVGKVMPGALIPLIIELSVLVLVVHAVVYLLKKSAKEIRWFLVLIILPLALFMYFSDIIRHSFTSMLLRYQILDITVISLIVTNLLKDKIREGQMLYAGIYLGLIVLGLASIVQLAGKRYLMIRPDSESNIQTARLISKAGHPLLLTDFNTSFANFLVILNDSKSGNADIMYCKGKIPDIRDLIKDRSYSNIYVIHASDGLVGQLRSQFRENMLPFYQKTDMWNPQIWQISR